MANVCWRTPLLRACLLFGCLSFCVTCARKPDAAKESASEVIRSEEEICNLLTADDVAAELKQPVTARVMPSSGKYSAPQCGWLAGDAPDSPGFLLSLFFHPDSADGPRNFTEKVKDVCKAPSIPGKEPEPPQVIEGLGDEATLCRRLLVRKGNSFFFIYRQKGDAAVPWQDGGQRLARKVVSRLP